jgi:hypothetical protein
MMDFIDCKDPQYGAWLQTLTTEDSALVGEMSLSQLGQLTDDQLEKRAKLRSEYLKARAYQAVRESKIKDGKRIATQEKNEPKSKAQEALDIARCNCAELFTDQHGQPYAAVNVKGHIETLALNSTRFRNWISRVYYDNSQSLLNGEDISNALNVLKAEAEFGENTKKLSLRVAESPEAPETIYYDLANSKWEAVKITPDGWTVEPAPTLFVRYNNQQAQDYPERDYPEGIFDRFFELINVKTEEDKLLLKCYIIASFVPEIPKPVLMLHGEQGAAKSTTQEEIKQLVDPSSVKTLSFPRDINELVQKLSHNYIAYFDNISHIRDWISDELCKAVTGSGFSKRMLYTNDDDVIYNFVRCIGFNGINLGATRADLLDRGLIIQLQRIPDNKRRKIKEIWADFQSLRPQVLGYIFDTLSRALKLKKEGQIELNELPRMADFAEIAEAISRAMGYPENEFLEAYYKNIGLQTTEAIEANPIAVCITKFMHDKDSWTGSFGELLEELERAAQELKINTTRLEVWPKSPSIFSRRINEVVTNLRQVGIEVEKHTDNTTNTRLLEIRKMPPVSPVHPESGNQTQIEHPESGDTGCTGGDIHTSDWRCPYGCKDNFATEEDVLSRGVLVHPGRPIAVDMQNQSSPNKGDIKS